MKYRFGFRLLGLITSMLIGGASADQINAALFEQLALSTPTPPHQGNPVLSPEQTAALLKQGAQLKPEELQAIAKTIQAQNVAAQPPSHPADGLIEETVVVTATPVTVKPKEATEYTPLEKAQAHNLSVEEMQREEAFDQLLNDVLPLDPEQITTLHKGFDKVIKARATPAAPPPTPNVISYPVQLEPGSQPPVIRLAAGFVSTVLFVDSCGAPWPIAAYSIGDPQSFNIQWDQKSNAIFIQSMKPYSHGNLAVRLYQLDTPVMLTLVSGQKNVDFRVDLHIPLRSQNCPEPIIETQGGAHARVNPILMNFLDGIPPRGSVKLAVSGGHGEAWLADSRVYFRTKLSLLSPAWTATVASPDGTHVYELVPTTYLLASRHGKTIDIKLSGL